MAGLITAPRLVLTLIAKDPVLAKAAVCCGVDRVMVDMERLGKAERQVGRGLFLSDHGWEDVDALRKALPKGALFVRLDPLHAGSARQIETALSLGADGLMTPFFHRAEQALAFADLVAGRATVVPLVETRGAVENLDVLLRPGVIPEFHVGLNDLALDLGLASLEALWGDPLLDRIGSIAAAHGAPFGVGGVTDPRLADLPIDPRWVIAEHRRVGSTRALLGRSFRVIHASAEEAGLKASVDAIQAAFGAAAT